MQTRCASKMQKRTKVQGMNGEDWRWSPDLVFWRGLKTSRPNEPVSKTFAASWSEIERREFTLRAGVSAVSWTVLSEREILHREQRRHEHWHPNVSGEQQTPRAWYVVRLTLPADTYC